MGKTSAITSSEEPNMDLLTTAPDEWEFTTEVAEAPTGIELEMGDAPVILFFEGVETIKPDNGKDEPFELLMFSGRDGNRYSINPSYKLKRYFETAEAGWYRIALVKEIPTGRGLNKMKDYKVDKKK